MAQPIAYGSPMTSDDYLRMLRLDALEVLLDARPAEAHVTVRRPESAGRTICEATEPTPLEALAAAYRAWCEYWFIFIHQPAA